MKNGSVRNMLRLLAPYKFKLILAFICSAVFVFCSLILPLLFGEMINDIVGKGNVNFKRIGIYSVWCALIILVAFFAQRITSLLNNKTSYTVTKDLRNKCFAKLQKMPLSYIDSHSNGQTVSLIISDCERVGEGLLMTLEQLFTGVLTVAVILVFMFVKELSVSSVPYITILIIVLTPMGVVVAKFIAKKSYSHFNLRAQANAEQTGFINEIVTNQKIVKAYNMEERILQSFESINEKNRRIGLKSTFFSSTVNPTTRFLYNVTYALVCLLGGFLIVNGSGLTVGDLFVFLSYTNQYTKPFNEITGVLTELQNSFACADRINEFLNEPEQSDGVKQIENFKGNVSFNDVYFSYDKNVPLLQNLNLNVKSGQKIAIVGPTGCGKTTLINLIISFYDPISGSVTFDGQDVKNFKRSEISNNVGTVLQDCYIFTGTVKQNVALGNENATDEQIELACKNAFAHDFICKTENGYNTVISENCGLSNGQKQLIAISRLMLNRPPVLILDEATSSVDYLTEYNIVSGLARVSDGRTTFTVAHRLSTIKNADLILVMNGGNVIEQGSHEQLMKKQGFYFNLYNSQFG